jgi:hypothetical protein
MHSQAQETQPCATRLAFAANGVSPKYMYFRRCEGGLPRPDSALLEWRNAATCLPHFLVRSVSRPLDATICMNYGALGQNSKTTVIKTNLVVRSG